MKHAKERVRTATTIDAPFSDDEKARFRAFLKATGRSAGPWVRILILQAMEEEVARNRLTAEPAREGA